LTQKKTGSRKVDIDMTKKKQKDLKTTITGTIFTSAVAAAPFFPEYAAGFAVVQAVSGALMAFFAKDAE
jgi:hypothetical protein